MRQNIKVVELVETRNKRQEMEPREGREEERDSEAVLGVSMWMN